MATKRMPADLPLPPQGSHREAGGDRVPVPSPRPQLSLQFDREAQMRRDDQALTAMFAAAVRAYGGPDALRAALGEKETYLSKISESMSGLRPVQVRWLGPLLDDPRAAAIILGYLSERAGFEPPVSHRQVTDEEVARAAVEVLSESGQLRETFRTQIAKRLGVRVEEVKL